MSTGLMIALVCAIAAIVIGAVWISSILAKPAGNARMQEIAAAIQAGAKAYLNRQYMTIGIVGVILFHLLFLVSPMAGKNLIGSGMLGEYFRQFVSYGVIALALVLYEWKRVTQEHDSRATLRGEAAKDAKGGAA